MAGVATVTLNAALDRTLQVERWVPGGKSRVLAESAQAGGKGLNVSRVLRELDVPTRAIALVGGATGREIAADLERDGFDFLALPARGESRTCLEIVAPDGRAAQLHGRGVDAGEAELEAVTREIEALPEAFGWVAICGSLPPGLPSDAVARLVASARESGRQVAVDASGPPLAHAWRAAPDLVRVNADEVREILPQGEVDAAPYASLGAPAAGIVSRGESPYQAWTQGGPVLRVTPPTVEAVNPIGCGDAMLAGWLASRLRGATFASSLRPATALAAAEACSPRAGRPDAELARSLEGRVRVEPESGS